MKKKGKFGSLAAKRMLHGKGGPRTYFDSADHFSGKETGKKQPSFKDTHHEKKALPLVVEVGKDGTEKDVVAGGAGAAGGGK